MDTWKNNNFVISTKKELLDIITIHHFLSNDSYWSKGITREKVVKSIKNIPLCFGIYETSPSGMYKQAGFGRVITDLTTFGYLSDVFVLPAYRGKGLSKWLVEVITEQEDLLEVRRLMLATHDAHSLYAGYGFVQLDQPLHFMEKRNKILKS
ncbi:GNAT superfamily N-acetyltransferase [Peribacillus deserti]|uniref:GNAT superfamily N-acetyltransferase n=1 Tax=Peribacillus deserti TaxID=673318 RepID=A0ABS2QMY2_9BACI|nr:GNAT family N-acetyltransferase [Peribacillus deserti]MBM7694524.1 GNAT superfamily N-acetyltransferase [Peribacillus deserti]